MIDRGKMRQVHCHLYIYIAVSIGLLLLTVLSAAMIGPSDRTCPVNSTSNTPEATEQSISVARAQ
jgi:hypothetical protein